MNFNDLCEQHNFTCRPTLYFSPHELDKDKGEYPYIIRFVEEEITTRVKAKKDYWTMVVELIADKRKRSITSLPISPDIYLIDLNRESMGKLNRLRKAGVNIYAVPIQITLHWRWKGKHLWPHYEFQVIEHGELEILPYPVMANEKAQGVKEPAPATIPKSVSSALPAPMATQITASQPKPVSSNPIVSSISKVPAARPSRPLTEHGTPLRSSGILYDEYGEIADGCGDCWWWELKDEEMKALGKWDRAEKAKATSREQQMALEAISQTIKATWKATGVLQLPGIAVEGKSSVVQEQKATGPKSIEQDGKGRAPSIEPSQNTAMKAQGGEVKKAKSSDVGSIFIWEDDK